MPNVLRPKEVGQAAYETVASDINRRLGNPFLIPWEALSPEDRAAWASAGRAEREAALAAMQSAQQGETPSPIPLEAKPWPTR